MKSLAIVGPTFFGYGSAVSLTFRKLGYPAKFFNERQNDTLIAKIIYRSGVLKRIFSFYLRRQRACLVSDILLSKPEAVIFISPEFVNGDEIHELKRHGCRVVCYMWDSFANKPAALRFLDCFDSVATFDPKDSEQYGLRLINLFAEDEFDCKNEGTIAGRSLELAYVGTNHSNRLSYLSLLKRFYNLTNRNIFVHAFHGNLIYYLRNIALYGRKAYEIGTWAKLSKAEIAGVFKASKIVLDITHPDQEGLTSRTFETLAANAILLTNNRNAPLLLPDFADQIVVYDYDCFEVALKSAFLKMGNCKSDVSREYLFINRFVAELLEMAT